MDRRASGETALGATPDFLTRLLGCMLVVVAGYMLYRSLT